MYQQLGRRPLDKKLQEQCKEAAAATHIAYMEQQTANKRLDFELARLKNCGEFNEGGRYVSSQVAISMPYVPT